MSAPDSICWSKLAAMSGSMFLRSSSDKLVTDLGFYTVSQKLPKKSQPQRSRRSQFLGDKVLERLGTTPPRRFSKSSLPCRRPFKALCAETWPCGGVGWQEERVPQGFHPPGNTDFPGWRDRGGPARNSLETTNRSHWETSICSQGKNIGTAVSC